MTATAIAFDPALDLFDETDVLAPQLPELQRPELQRPELRLVHGGEYGRILPTAQARASVEVVRRRRFFALVAITAAVLAIAWIAGVSLVSFGAAAGGAADGSGFTDAPAVHVVLPGDSYGAIAANLGIANPAAAAEHLRAANGGGELVVGQRLVFDLATVNAEMAG